MTVKDGKYIAKENLKELVAVVVGTRPGIIMFAPIIHELEKRNVPHFIIHTGQHYSPNMDSELFEDLELPQPDYHIEGVAEKTSHAGQTAVMLEGVEKALVERQPGIILVGGDANTNLAAALAARKLRIQVGHVESGERSFDWRMPEEHNRRIIDHISELLFTTNEKGKKQLEKESVQGEIIVSGNTIVDASINHAEIAKQKSDVLATAGVEVGKYVLLTSHREENVDDAENLKQIIQGAELVSKESGLPVLFLAHPRTQKRIDQFGLKEWLAGIENIITIDGRRYLDFMQLLTNCHTVLTDSGGVQQEAFIHQKPCITLRDNTEWSETIERGGNKLAGANAHKILASFNEIQANVDNISWGWVFGDGRAAATIVDAAVKAVSEGEK